MVGRHLLGSFLISRGGDGQGAQEVTLGGGGAYDPRYGLPPGCE